MTPTYEINISNLIHRLSGKGALDYLSDWNKLIRELHELRASKRENKPVIQADRVYLCECGWKHVKPYPGLRCTCGREYNSTA